jgi:2-methylisocitrate lyase-like PEP mutase family enzyme
MSMTQADKAHAFRAMHHRGNPLVLFNVWDAGSAAVVAKAGAKALATGSWSVATAFGYNDGEELPFDLVLSNLTRIARSVDLPVSADLEMGYGVNAAGVSDSVARALETGVIGFNLEDGLTVGGLREIREQVERLAAARHSADTFGISAYLNARVDLFLQRDVTEHAAAMPQAIARFEAYAAAGVDGFFVPGLVDIELIRQLCAVTSLPLNVMSISATPPMAALRTAGVARVSHGPSPFRTAMAALEQAANHALALQ